MRNPSKNPLAWAAVVTVAVVLLRVLISGISIAVNSKVTVSVGAMESGLVAALLTPTLSAYVASRHNSMRPHEEKPPEPAKPK